MTLETLNSRPGMTVKKNVAVKAAESVARGWRRILFLGVALLFFLLGAAGAILPGLPATPFLVVTAYFLVRSSPRLHEALLRSRVFGPILVDWHVHGGVRTDIRVKSIVAVTITVALTIALSGYALWPSAAVILLAVVGITVILRLPTAHRSKDGVPPSDDNRDQVAGT